ncbi:MAG: GlsB/YeaQ/YmgE family stress response membrane protein [Mangrovibacterium sp.]
MEIIGSLITGAIAGWLAGKVMNGGGFGLLINIILGIIGGAVGNKLFSFLDLSIGNNWISSVITGMVGAIIILYIISILSSKKK